MNDFKGFKLFDEIAFQRTFNRNGVLRDDQLTSLRKEHERQYTAPIRYKLTDDIDSYGSKKYFVEQFINGKWYDTDLYEEHLITFEEARFCPDRFEKLIYDKILTNEADLEMRKLNPVGRSGIGNYGTQGKSNFTLSLRNDFKTILTENNIKITPYINQLIEQDLINRELISEENIL